MSPGLERIAEKARTNSTCQFTSLAHHITPELLERTLNKIPNSSGKGVDGLSKDDVKLNKADLIPRTISEIHNHGYRPSPVRRVHIPKPGTNKQRPIGVPNIWGRAVQGSCAKIMEQIYEQDFLPCSYGGRPKRSCHQALAYLGQTIANRKVSWVFEADLKNFFGTLDHKWLLNFVEHRIGDPRILTLIRRWLKAGVMEEGEYKSSEVGTPQGGSISVILSNVYLHYVLDLWFEKVVKPRLKGEAYLVRYLDDFIVCFEYHTDASRFQTALKGRLAKFNLELEPTKTKTIAMGKFAARDSKSQGKRKPETLVFLGFTMYGMRYPWGFYGIGFKPNNLRVRRFLNSLKELMRRSRHLPLAKQQEQINSRLRGFYNYFGLPLCAKTLKSIYRNVVKFWRKCLSRRSQTGKINWDKFNRILEFHPIVRPIIRLKHKDFMQMGFQQMEN